MPRAKWLVLSMFLLIPVFYFIVLTLPEDFNQPDHRDFFVFWMGANMIHQGQNPYIIQDWNMAFTAFDQHYTGALPAGFGYAPHFAYSLIPFTLIPYQSALIISQVLSMVGLIAAIYIVMSAWKIPNAGPYILPVILGLSIFRPVVQNITLGQMGALYLFSLAVTIWLWEHDYWFIGSIALTILTFKTTFSIPILIFTALWLLFAKRWKALMSLSLIAIGLTIIDWPFLADWFSILTNHAAQNASNAINLSVTFWGIAAKVCSTQQPCTLFLGGFVTIVLSVGLVALLWIYRRTWSPLLVLSLIILVANLITPYMYPYDQLILVVPVLYIVYNLIERGYPFLVSALFFIVISVIELLFLPLAFISQTDSLSAIIPILLLGAVLYFALRKPNIPNQQLVVERLPSR